jgi:hypothetical protein
LLLRNFLEIATQWNAANRRGRNVSAARSVPQRVRAGALRAQS